MASTSPVAPSPAAVPPVNQPAPHRPPPPAGAHTTCHVGRPRSPQGGVPARNRAPWGLGCPQPLCPLPLPLPLPRLLHSHQPGCLAECFLLLASCCSALETPLYFVYL